MTKVVLNDCIVELTIDVVKLPEPPDLLRCVATLLCLWPLEVIHPDVAAYGNNFGGHISHDDASLTHRLRIEVMKGVVRKDKASES